MRMTSPWPDERDSRELNKVGLLRRQSVIDEYKTLGLGVVKFPNAGVKPEKKDYVWAPDIIHDIFFLKEFDK